jgi:hypothetical protein
MLAGVADTDNPLTEPQVGADGCYDDWPAWAKNPLSEDARHTLWRDIPKYPPLNQNPNTRRFVEWMRRTHNGRRTPLNRGCSECDDQMTDGEVTE